jgi:hypothetical protein
VNSASESEENMAVKASINGFLKIMKKNLHIFEFETNTTSFIEIAINIDGIINIRF